MNDNLSDFDEGIGTVYERFMLNHFFARLLRKYTINTVLEYPIYGMTGLTGLNSFYLAQRGCEITLVDFQKEHLEKAELLWNYLNKKCQFHLHKNINRLPVKSGSFDLVWNFAALWWVKRPDKLIKDMVRLSNNLIIIFIPNRLQPGYLLRKWLIDRNFFRRININWIKPSQIRSLFRQLGLKPVEEGALDMPPWPDTAMPLSELIGKLGLSGNKSRSALEKHWHWDIISYYRGTNLTLIEKIKRYAFIENLPLPLQIKLLWAHHRYFLFTKSQRLAKDRAS
jgi:SAM-dependent methyltransferase